MLAFLLTLTVAGCAPEEADPAEPRAGESVEETWARLLEIEDSLDRTASLATFLATLRPEDAGTVESLATDFGRRHREIDDLLLVNAWARLDPEAAAQRALHAQSPIAEAARADVVREWARVDPNTATAALAAQESAVERSLVRGWYESGEPGLEEYIFAEGNSRTGQNFLATYLAEIREDRGAEAVIEWVDGVRAKAELPMIMIVHAHRKGLAVLAEADIDRALAYCDEHCDKPYSDSARSRLVDRLALIGHGREATLWLARSENAEPGERGRAARIALRGWMRESMDEALDWANAALAQHEGAEWFVPPGRLALQVITRRDPERALAWVDVLPEDHEREDALVRIGRRWVELDAEAGAAWIESSPLDEEARARARTPAKGRHTRPASPR